MSPEDRALAEACLRGEESAWRELVDRFGGLLLHVVKRTGRACEGGLGEAEAEDVCADVFAALVRDPSKLAGYDPRYALATWLGAMARSRTIDHVRSRNAARRREVERPVPDAGPEDAGVEAERLLARLPERDRTVLRLFYLSGKKYREIAEILGLPVNTVASILARALARLREPERP